MSTTTNEQISAQEVAAFRSDAPDRYFAYQQAQASGFDPVRRLHTGDRISTWTGDELATINVANTPFRDNFGSVRQNFRARAINGATYSGTAFLSAGDYVRMRKVAA